MKTALATLLVLLAGVLQSRAQDADLILVNGKRLRIEEAIDAYTRAPA